MRTFRHFGLRFTKSNAAGYRRQETIQLATISPWVGDQLQQAIITAATASLHDQYTPEQMVGISIVLLDPQKMDLDRRLRFFDSRDFLRAYETWLSGEQDNGLPIAWEIAFWAKLHIEKLIAAAREAVNHEPRASQMPHTTTQPGEQENKPPQSNGRQASELNRTTTTATPPATAEYTRIMSLREIGEAITEDWRKVREFLGAALEQERNKQRWRVDLKKVTDQRYAECLRSYIAKNPTRGRKKSATKRDKARQSATKRDLVKGLG